MRGLLRRRNKIMTDLVEDNDLDQAQVFYLLNKVNIAFEVLKCEVEGTIEHVVNSSRWRGNIFLNFYNTISETKF